MTLKELHTAVQRRADTPTTKINAAVVSRVIAELFAVLATLDAQQLTGVLARAVAAARKRRAED